MAPRSLDVAVCMDGVFWNACTWSVRLVSFYSCGSGWERPVLMIEAIFHGRCGQASYQPGCWVALAGPLCDRLFIQLNSIVGRGVVRSDCPI